MNCCDANGDCRQGRDCPVRAQRYTSPKTKSSEITETLLIVGLMSTIAICIGMLCKLWSMA
jgi:hypothetical protein